MNVTIGEMVDRLSIVNIKIFMLENVKRIKDTSDTEIAEATRKTNILNVQRNSLISEIDKLFGNDNPNNMKMYGK